MTKILALGLQHGGEKRQPTTVPSETQKEFSHRLHHEWLPTFCLDPSRRYSEAGFRADSLRISTEDAGDFMRALDCGLVEDTGGGRYRLSRSRALEFIFWEGLKAKTPRPIFLWLEPVITMAAVGRLHLDYGWPKTSLGTQSATWEFDITAFLPNELESEYLVGEVKKSTKELEALLAHMQSFCHQGVQDEKLLSPGKKNSYRKWRALFKNTASLFWAVGPGGQSHLFYVSRSGKSGISLNELSEDHLTFSGDADAARPTDATALRDACPAMPNP